MAWNNTEKGLFALGCLATISLVFAGLAWYGTWDNVKTSDLGGDIKELAKAGSKDPATSVTVVKVNKTIDDTHLGNALSLEATSAQLVSDAESFKDAAKDARDDSEVEDAQDILEDIDDDLNESVEDLKDDIDAVRKATNGDWPGERNLTAKNLALQALNRANDNRKEAKETAGEAATIAVAVAPSASDIELENLKLENERLKAEAAKTQPQTEESQPASQPAGENQPVAPDSTTPHGYQSVTTGQSSQGSSSHGYQSVT